MMRAAYRFAAFCTGFSILLVVLCFTAHPAWGAARGASGQSALTMRAEDEKAVSWTLNADKVTSISASEVIEAEGNVILQRGDEYLKADYARYYAGTKWVFLRGNVSARMGKDTMQAEEAEFDLRSRVGWLKRGQIYMDGPHMYFAGERIDKHWGDVYSFKQAKVTACDGDVPAWSLEAEEAVVEIDGYAQLWRPRFQVKDVPIMASPWMILPAKKERQTGFLTPEYGQSTKRGFYYNQPFFWAIDDSQDMTFNEYYMDKRGFMQGVEYRARPSVRETAWVRFDWIHDKVEDVSGKNFNADDGLKRSNQERYWLRGMYEGFLGDPKWKIRADLDFVSDQDYLHEFKSSYSGYDRSRTDLFDLFRRDIQEKDLDRKSGFLLFRDWDRVSVALSSTYIQNQRLGHGNTPKSADTTVQRLPQLDLFLHKGSIVDALPLEIAASAETGYMYRRDGTRGMRYAMEPTLSLPVNGKYGSFMASAGVQQIFYGTDTYSKTEAGQKKQDGESQTMPTFQADGSTEVARVFQLASSLSATEKNVGESRWTAIRHAVQPRARYRNIPLDDQSKNPHYDSKDRVRALNELTYSVTNVLTRKREQVIAQKPSKEDEKPEPVVQTDYLDFVRFTLEQSYDIRESTRTDERREYERRPFRDIIADLEISLDEFISLTSRTYWSPYEDEVTSHDHGVRFRNPAWGSIYLGFGYRGKLDEYLRERTNEVRTLTMNGDLHLYGPLSVGFAYSHDYERTENVERTLRLIYNHQCFQFIGIVSKDAMEESYGMRIVVTGLGD